MRTHACSPASRIDGPAHALTPQRAAAGATVPSGSRSSDTPTLSAGRSAWPAVTLVSSRLVRPAGSFVETELAKDAGLSPLAILAQNVEGVVGVDHRLATQAGKM